VTAADLVWKPAVELARLMASKEVSPVEVVEAHLERIARLDGKLRAFITVMADAARAAARAAEAAVIAGGALGPLHGVPLGLKDLVHTKGVRTTGGSRLLADWVPAEDATVATRLVGAGAIVLGKLNMHEFAYGPEGLNPHYGTPWNPWDARTHRICGGSSSGSGAAVAAGLCAGALGSDTGGSIRIPAALCGISGLKPTYGRVSRAGVLPLAWSLDHVGPMCRTAADCALMLRPMAGYDPRDPTTSVLPVPDYTAALTGDVRGLRVGVLRSFFLESTGVALAAAVEGAVKTLEGLGAAAQEVALSRMDVAAPSTFAIISAESYAYHEDWVRTRAAEYGPDVLERLRVGAFVSGADYLKGQRARTLLRDDVDALLAKVDVLVCATTPVVATSVGQGQVTIEHETVPVRPSLVRFTRPFNATGHPVASIPCGFTAGGLPVGLQIVGRPFDEATVLRVADAYQRATDWHERRPPVDEPATP
jgi:aspartyl-tRNA(Asn)/glutamyl-tRNA(Gln) amidotransferase subunit A